eukprot:scaffold135082_cov28-Tisochrysis_lutea.AAC.2
MPISASRWSTCGSVLSEVDKCHRASECRKGLSSQFGRHRRSASRQRRQQETLSRSKSVMVPTGAK